MTQTALALLVGVAQSTLADWERGKTRPRPSALERVCTALKCEVWELIPEFTPANFVNGHPPLPDNAEPTAENLEKHQNFWHTRRYGPSEDQVYIRLFDHVTRFVDEMYAAPEIGTPENSVFAGDIGTSRNKQAVLLTKRIWQTALLDETEASLADRVFKALEAFQTTMRQFLGIAKISRDTSKTVD